MSLKNSKVCCAILAFVFLVAIGRISAEEDYAELVRKSLNNENLGEKQQSLLGQLLKALFGGVLRGGSRNGGTSSPSVTSSSDGTCQNVPEDEICYKCRALVEPLLAYKRNKTTTDDDFKKAATGLCYSNGLGTLRVCTDLVKLNYPPLKYIVERRDNLTAETICGVVLQSNNCKLNITGNLDFSIKIIGQAPKCWSSKDIPTNSCGEIRIGHLTDIHYQPDYTKGVSTKCYEPNCCRADQVLGQYDPTDLPAGKFGDYACDIPWDIIESVMKYINTLVCPHYFYITGDYTDHSYWNTSLPGVQGVTNKVISFIAEQLLKKCPSIKIFPILGNHDQTPMNCFAPNYIDVTDTDIDSTQQIYDQAANEWPKWINNETVAATLKQGGYYTTLVEKKLRIIALNNNDAFTYNWWLLYDATYLLKQLEWLQDTLLEAEKNREYVHIILHIPSNEHSLYTIWAREYWKIIDRFWKIISGQFTGHTHYDQFNLFYSRNNLKCCINVAWNGASLTTWNYINPNFKIHTVDDDTFQVIDQQTYNLDIVDANKNNKTDWKLEYDFRKAYGLSDMSPAILDTWTKSVLAGSTAIAKKYYKYFVKEANSTMLQTCDNNCLLNAIADIPMNQYCNNTVGADYGKRFNRTVNG